MMTIQAEVARDQSPPLRGNGLRAAAVDRVSVAALPPRRFSRAFRRRGTPVVITGALDAVIPLDLAKLMAHIGDQEVPTRCYGPERFTRPKTEWTSYCEMQTRTVRSYADLLMDGTARREAIYLAQVEIG